MPFISASKVLIVDDQEINRIILKKILVPEFSVIEAVNGQEALNILHKDGNSICAILLDLIMPVMDGFGFLRQIRNTDYASLPVIVLTGDCDDQTEAKALEEGAYDFIHKPYQATVLKTRLKNSIARNQMDLFNRMKYLAEHDPLTDLYNRSKFFTETRNMLNEHKQTSFVFIRMDIDRFSMINSFWGEDEGDHLLCHIALRVSEEAGRYDLSTYGRINSDIFCMVIPYDKEQLAPTLSAMIHHLQSLKSDYVIKPSFGIYPVADVSEPVESMYERASLAAASCKGISTSYIGIYDEKMQETSRWEQEVSDCMQQALDNGEFIPWLQPKYSLKSELPCGAEALVRWNHPTLGILGPGRFVPIFERNNFIGKVDYTIWEQVCIMIRKWIDSGIKPMPISVNISRMDLYNPKIIDILCDLVDKYRIPPKLLNLELTESAYMDNPELMTAILKELHSKGFILMMDDFGSGYSSLGKLKDLPIDILKIDMSLVHDATASSRGKIVLSSIILMAGWLNLPVIVEGAETREQVDFLKSIGSNYVQGYYFKKPMPPEEYQELMLTEGKRTDIQDDYSEISQYIWDRSPDSEQIFYHQHIPQALYEYLGTDGRPLRVNQAFNVAFNYHSFALSGEILDNFLSTGDRDKVNRLILSINESHPFDECTIFYTDRSHASHRLRISYDLIGFIQSRKIVLLTLVIDPVF